MSKSTLGAIGGAAIGFFVGGPLGAKIGWSLGSFLFAAPGPDMQGPRLDSLAAESLDYGAPIPIVYGRARLAGFRMWQRPIREQTHTESVGGKGGGGGATSTSYSYYGTFAVGLCEGEIIGIRKIWADSILIYDAGDSADIETIITSNDAVKTFTVYTGSATQDADSLIQATQGAANTPAYRHLAYIVFDDLPLEKYGNRIPNITCEVVKNATATGLRLAVENRDTGILFKGSGAAGVGKAAFLNADGICRVTVWDSNIVYLFDYNGNYRGTDTRRSNEAYPSGNVGSNFPVGILRGEPVRILNLSSAIGSDTILPVGPADGTSLDGIVCDLTDPLPAGEFVGGVALCVDQTHALIFTAPTDAQAGGRIDKWYLISYDGSATVTLIDSGTTSTTYGIDEFGFGNSTNIYTACIMESNLRDVWATKSSGYGHVASYEIADGVLSERGRINYAIHSLSLPSIWADNGTAYIVAFDEFVIATRIPALTVTSPALSTIVSDISTRAGLTAPDIDVTELTDEVDGYIITSNMSARAAIEPLQKAYFFDGAEYGNKINFVKRGGASIKSIPQDDLGATDYGSDKYALKQTRMQDSELPSEVSIGYISAVRDYEIATQRAQRINYSIPNSVGQELAIVLNDDRALQIADITLYNAYVEREKFEFSLTSEHIDLNPTDVITVTHDGDSRAMRLIKLSYGDVIECEAISDDPQVYTSAAIAAPEAWTGQAIGLAGPTRVEYMDIPILRNSDNDAGMYYSACGYYAAWTGAQIFKSLDGGASYNEVDATFVAGTIGSATTSLADAVATLWDRDNTVTVDLVSGKLSSATEDNVLRGANYLLVGSEIIQFANATLNADGTYTLDTLLRGRRGTEWATDSHAIGDRVVLLSEALLGRFEAIINTERAYKAVTLGQYVEGTTAKNATNSGACLRPFSPAYISGTRDGSNNLTITWMRRSRCIGAPLGTRPLFEDSESYEVDIMSGTTVLRTISASTATASYTAAQQTADGLTPGNPVTINVYQLSGTAGRGYSAEATI